MSSTMTIDAANDLVQKINLASKDLGYMPFNNITVIQGKNSESASVSGVCPLCGKTTEFSSGQKSEVNLSTVPYSYKALWDGSFLGSSSF